MNIAPNDICDVLDKLSKVRLPARVRVYVLDVTKNFGRAKLVLRDNRHHARRGVPRAAARTVCLGRVRGPARAAAAVAEPGHPALPR